MKTIYKPCHTQTSHRIRTSSILAKLGLTALSCAFSLLLCSHHTRMAWAHVPPYAYTLLLLDMKRLSNGVLEEKGPLFPAMKKTLYSTL